MKCAICTLWKEKRISDLLKKGIDADGIRKEEPPEAVALMHLNSNLSIGVCSSHLTARISHLQDIVYEGKWGE